MGCGRYLIDHNLMVKLLHLPDDTRITYIWPVGGGGPPRRFRIYVEHDDLPEGDIVDMEPVFKSTYDPFEVALLDWGIREPENETWTGEGV